MLRLDQDIKYLQGVGPARADLLGRELAIKTVGDLLAYYPYKHIDRTHFFRIADINGTMPYVQIVGEILSFEDFGEGRKKRLVAHFSDGTGVIDLVWFQGVKYIAKQYDLHRPYIVFGRPQPFKGRLNIAHPEMEEAPSGSPEWGMSEGVQQALFDEGIALPPPPLGGVGGGSSFVGANRRIRPIVF